MRGSSVRSASFFVGASTAIALTLISIGGFCGERAPSGSAASASPLGTPVPRTLGIDGPCTDGSTARISTGFETTTLQADHSDSQRSILTVPPGTGTCPTFTAARASLGVPSVQFEGGSDSERLARIVRAPDAPTNSALLFWIKDANVDGQYKSAVKGRIQMNVYGNRDANHLKMSVKMYLPPDMRYLRDYPGKIDWLTISEWWNNAPWKADEQYPFRITLTLAKTASELGAPIHFSVQAQTMNRTTGKWNAPIWSETNSGFSLPFGEWIRLEYELVEGDEQSGRFSLFATTKSSGRVAIFDHAGYTRHPDDPHPDGFTEFNPLKLYTSKRVIDHIRAEGGVLQVLWDDLNIVACQPSGLSNGSDCTY